MHSPSQISVEIAAEKNLLIFKCTNHFFSNINALDKSTGTGIANVKRRLQLLYAGKHHLMINKSEHNHKVLLTLNTLS